MSRSGNLTRVPAFLLAAFLLVAPLSASAAVTTRPEILARARVWVAAEVPYSQSRYASFDGALLPKSAVNPQYTGYRTDCSGFVSMALGFRSARGNALSLSTATLDNVLAPIRKRDLRPGDVILRPNDLIIDGRRVPYGHAVIFAGWADAAHTRYVAYHESSGAGGAVRAVVRWGTSGFGDAPGFAPYRYPGVEDAVRPPATP